MPELLAYRDFLAKYYPSVEVKELKIGNVFEQTKQIKCDIYWRFMGLDCSRFISTSQKVFIVHDYNSLSTPPFARLKNSVKKIINVHPQLRIFLNRKVESGFHFADEIPRRYREMGVSKLFFLQPNSSKKLYDFVCIGGFDRGPVIINFLDKFTEGEFAAEGITILLVGNVPSSLLKRYANCENILFKGRVSNNEIPKLISQARYGVNLVPSVFPYNIQPATKVLEYSAVGIPVITTDYWWARDFEKKQAATFFKLNRNMSNFTIANVRNFKFVVPDVSNYGWEKVINDSRVFSFLDR